MVENKALNVTVGERIKTLRRKYHMTQAELATAAEADRSYVSNIENGQRNASLTFLYRICQTFGITLREFFEDESFMEI
ncbi:MAG: helix-turn-helix transcriptional regulator [Erysipelotrichaceae bacterium]|nr:helix-turn-helix transcriptional regulator [Erysipelotrichaceae bacterium]